MRHRRNFVVREAGNILDSIGLGSIGIAVRKLKCPLMMVLGHESCGAFALSLQSDDEIGRFPDEIRELVSRIRVNIPEILKKLDNPEKVMNDAIRENVGTTARFLELAYQARVEKRKSGCRESVLLVRDRPGNDPGIKW